MGSDDDSGDNFELNIELNAGDDEDDVQSRPPPSSSKSSDEGISVLAWIIIILVVLSALGSGGYFFIIGTPAKTGWVRVADDYTSALIRNTPYTLPMGAAPTDSIDRQHFASAFLQAAANLKKSYSVKNVQRLYDLAERLDDAIPG